MEGNNENIYSKNIELIDSINIILGEKFCNYGYKIKYYDHNNDAGKLFEFLKKTKDCYGNQIIGNKDSITYLILNPNNEIASYIIYEILEKEDSSEKILSIIGSCTALSERRKGLSVLLRYILCKYAIYHSDIICVGSYAMNDNSAGLLKNKFGFEHVEEVGYNFSRYVFTNYNTYINIYGKKDNDDFINKVNQIGLFLEECKLLKNISPQHQQGGNYNKTKYMHKYIKYKKKYNNLKNFY